MTGKKKPHGKKGRKRSARGRPPRSAVAVRRAAGGDAWQLVHPRCALERADDIEEVQVMIEAGEMEIASDELRWLLDGCSDFIEAHRLLGELALGEDRDVKLARAHFGYAYQLGLKALRQAGFPGPLAYRLRPNQAFFEAGKGLAYCLRELGKRAMARDVVQQLLKCDPDDPLGLAAMLEGLAKADEEEPLKGD